MRQAFISAALKERSPPSDAVRVAAGDHLILKSTATEQELFITLERPRLAPLVPRSFRLWLDEAMALAELVPITNRIVACRDAKDDKFLELAVSGDAELVISGDNDLLDLNPFRGVSIITPAAFLRAAGVNSRENS